MKTFFTFIKNTFIYLSKHLNLLFIIAIIVLIFLLSFQCSRKNSIKQQSIKDQQNIVALHDTVKIQKMKNGALNFSISSYVATQNELKDLNRRLYDQIKEQSGKIVSLNDVIISLNQDKADLQKYIDLLKSNSNQITKLNDSTYSAPWTLAFKYDSTEFDIFKGQTIIALHLKDGFKIEQLKSELLERNSQIDLVFGQKVEDNKLRIFIESKYPGFSTKSMQGVLIDPTTNPYIKSFFKPKKFGVGPLIGYGIGSGLKGSVFIGIGLQYNVIRW